MDVSDSSPTLLPDDDVPKESAPKNVSVSFRDNDDDHHHTVMIVSAVPQQETKMQTFKNQQSSSSEGSLSLVSKQYDVGKKGYLTPCEKTMRAMDEDNRGYLTNAQVARIVEQTIDIRDHNITLRNWVLGLVVAVIVLAISDLGMALAAARIAKDTQLDRTTGELYIKGDPSTLVTTQARGIAITIDLYPGLTADADAFQGEDTKYAGISFVCISTAQLSLIFKHNQDSKEIALILQSVSSMMDDDEDEEEVITMGLDRSGASYNNTHVILVNVQNSFHVGTLTFDFDSNMCENYFLSTMGNHRRHLEQQHSHGSRYQAFQRHLNPAAAACPDDCHDNQGISSCRHLSKDDDALTTGFLIPNT